MVGTNFCGLCTEKSCKEIKTMSKEELIIKLTRERKKALKEYAKENV